jgi:MFS family permease
MATPTPAPAPAPASAATPAPASAAIPAPASVPGALDPLGEPTEPVRPTFQASLVLAGFGMWMAFLTPLQVLIPAQVSAAGDAGKVGNLAWVTGIGAAFALVSNPLAGALSDRTTSRFGRRHPWTLGGALVGAAALLLLATAHTVPALLVCWCLAQVGLNTMLASLTASVPDQVPHAQRATVSALYGLTQPLGPVVGVVLVTTVVTGVLPAYALVGAVVVLGAAVFVTTTADPPLPPALRPRFRWREFLAGFWIDPRQAPDFAWAWLTRFLVMLGQALGTGYLLYFLQDVIRREDPASGVAVLTGVYAVALLATIVVSGVLSDRLRRRKVFVAVSSVVMAVGALLVIVSPTWSATLVAAAVLGAGFGVYLAVDIALMSEVLPAARDRAKDLGVINIANTLPQLVAPVVAASLIGATGGYRALFVAALVAPVLGAVAVRQIRSVG